MSGLILLMYVGIVLILLISMSASNTINNDYVELCALCNNATFPKCDSNEISQLGKRLYCKQFDCTIAMSSNNGMDYVCLMDSKSISTETSFEEHSNLINPDVEPEILPMPLALETAATEATMAEQSEAQPEFDAEPALVEPIIDSYMPETITNDEVAQNAIESAPESNIEPISPSESADNTPQAPGADAAATQDDQANVNDNSASDIADHNPAGEVTEAVVENGDNNSAVSHTNNVDEAMSGDNDIQAEVTATEHDNSLDYVADAPADAPPINTDITIQPVTVDESTIETHGTADNNENSLTSGVANKPMDTSEAVDDQAGQKVTHNAAATPSELDADGVVTTASVPEQLQSCYVCTSADDALCADKPSKAINCQASEGNGNGCYTLLKDGEIKRGCLSVLDAHELASCVNDDDESCLACQGHNCNNVQWPQCYTCTSSDAAPMCAWWNYNTTAILQLSEFCQRYSDLCVVKIDSEGATIRRCVAHELATCDAGSSNCHTCADASCNGGVFPRTRRRCQQCVGNTVCADAQNATEALPCAIYRSNNEDGCFLYVNAAGQMQRGCTTSTAEYERCVASGMDKCRVCRVGDGCNSLPLMLAPTLSCSRCDSRLGGDDTNAASCAWAQSTASVSACSNLYLYYLEQTCQTVYQPEVELAVRGCSLDMGTCEPTNEWCGTCSTDACNTGNLRWESCLQCSSDQVGRCASDAAHIEARRCTAAVQPYELRGCFTRKDADTNIITRGCISDLTEEGMKYCKDNKKMCILCYETGCNNRLAPSAASHNKLSIAIIMLLLLKILL